MKAGFHIKSEHDSHQTLTYCWKDGKGNRHYAGFNVTFVNNPVVTAMQLELLAKKIREKAK